MGCSTTGDGAAGAICPALPITFLPIKNAKSESTKIPESTRVRRFPATLELAGLISGGSLTSPASAGVFAALPVLLNGILKLISFLDFSSLKRAAPGEMLLNILFCCVAACAARGESPAVRNARRLCRKGRRHDASASDRRVGRTGLLQQLPVGRCGKQRGRLAASGNA